MLKLVFSTGMSALERKEDLLDEWKKKIIPTFVVSNGRWNITALPAEDILVLCVCNFHLLLHCEVVRACRALVLHLTLRKLQYLNGVGC